MPDIHLDFETRSEIELKKSGAWRYSVDSTTDVLYACWAFGNEDVETWCPALTQSEAEQFGFPEEWHYGTEFPKTFKSIILQHGNKLVVKAHNAQFERFIWKNVVVKKYGGPEIRRDQFNCTAARAAASGLPRKLEFAAMALDVEQQKDVENGKLIKTFCSPRKPTKKDPRRWILPQDLPDEFKRFGMYCEQDVRTERDIDAVLPHLHPTEQKLFTFDLMVNERGLGLDIPLVEQTKKVVADLEAEIVEIVRQKTICTEYPEGLRPTQRDKMLNFFKSIGVELENMQADYIRKYAKVNAKTLPPLARELLFLRIEAGKSSTKKLASMGAYADPSDGRARGTLLFYGAHTGRWCLEEGTKVIVKDPKGNIRHRKIQHVRSTDLLWDGIEWVSHAGVVDSGMKEIIEHDGVRGSADHYVWTEHGRKIQLRHAKFCSVPILRSIPDGFVGVHPFEKPKCQNQTYDIQFAGPRNRFALSNGRIVSNSGKGVQPHNFIRGLLKYEEQLRIFDLLMHGDADIFRMLYQWPISAISQCMRGFIVAKKGRILRVVDYSAIEARVLAWLAQDQEILDAYVKGYDVYKVMASKLFNTKYEDVTSEQRRIGKNLILGCGYGLGAAKFVTYCEKAGAEVSLDFSKAAVRTYRTERKKIVSYWYDVERAAIQAVKEGRTYRNHVKLRNLKFFTDKLWFCIELPSGRWLRYYMPKVKVVEKFGEPGFQLSYKVEFRGRLVSEATYGGKLVENITQAVARDFLVHGMFAAEEAGYPVIGTVHDELLTEPPVEHGSYHELEKIVSQIPPWAAGCPISAEGFESFRYRKG